MRNRAYRRWQEQKKKKKVKKYWVCKRLPLTDGWIDWTKPSGPTDDPAIIGMVARTPAACSCLACGNPRKHWHELTIQEKRALEVDWRELDEAA